MLITFGRGSHAGCGRTSASKGSELSDVRGVTFRNFASACCSATRRSPQTESAASADCGMYPPLAAITTVFSASPTAASSSGGARVGVARAVRSTTARSASLQATQTQGPTCMTSGCRSRGGL
jgi:hypothetical protein